MPEIVTPELTLAFTAWFDIGSMQVIGEGTGGLRRVIPITGGHFSGEKISGNVLAGGSDWQTVRTDGITELEARYGLVTEDETIIQVHNQMLIRLQNDAPPIMRGKATLTAPTGPHDWLNKSVFVTTLNSPGDEIAPVVIRFFEVA